MIILIPILITILGLIYILSPIDFLPEIILGPIGLADDIVVILAIIISWMIYLALPLLSMLLNLTIGILVLGALVWLIVILYKKAFNKKDIKLKLKK